MVDNVTLNAGAGGVDLRTDDDGTAHWQYVKLAFGADNTQTIVGSIASNPFPVALSSVDNAVLDSIVTQLTAGAATSVKLEDVANAAADAGVPAMAVRKAIPVDLSGTDGDYEFLQIDNGRLWASVTIDAALPAGTNAIGKLAANSGVDIGDVDILSIAAGDNNIGNVDIVSGTITAVTDITNTIDSTISGDALTALQLIDDPVATLGTTTYTETTTKGTVIGAVRNDSLAALADTDNEIAPLQVDASGSLYVTGGGGGTEYTEDAAAVADPVGTSLILIREDARAGSLTTTDNDNVALRGNNKGEAYFIDTDANALLTTIDSDTNTIQSDTTGILADTAAIQTAVEIIDNSIHVDDAAFTLGTHSGVMMMGFAGTQSVDANDAGAIAMETDGAVHIHDGGNVITVDGTVTANPASGTIDTVTTVTTVSTVTAVTDITNTIDSTISGSALTALQLIDDVVYAEDIASQAADPGMAAYCVRDDALAANAGVNADGDYMPVRANNDGALWTQPSAGNLGGCKFFNDIDLDEADIDVATGACTVYGIYAGNTTAAPLFLKLFNTNTVAMGTTNADASILVPANADSDGAGVVIPIPVQGVAFGTALTVAMTTAAALDDNGAPGAGASNVTIFYQD